jgi:hypothetical protein
MNSFYWSLFGGDLDTDYPADEIVSLLSRTAGSPPP